MSWPYLVRLDTADHAANDPADTLAKRVIASNLDHLANSHGQVLVNWTSADGSGVERAFDRTASVWRSGSFPLRLRPDGTAFSIRVRLRGRKVSGTGSVTFRVRIGEGNFIDFSTSSTSSSWLTPTNAFSPSDPNVVPIPQPWVSWYTAPIAAPETLGGPAIAYDEALAYMDVNVTGGTTMEAELTGLHVAEVIGA